MISHITFEDDLRQRLLDLVYGQWSLLGVPFSQRGSSDEIIDPEALLCCSLEFLPTEPRLAEAVSEWVRANHSHLVRQRIYKQLDRSDPRARIWHALDRTARPPRLAPWAASEPCHGLASASDVDVFVHSLERSSHQRSSARVGHRSPEPASLLLAARGLLGHDIRHFLLVYLLAFPHGAKLRDVQAWSGHTYRAVSDAADSWRDVGVVSLESGFCRLLAQQPFRELLKIRSERLVIVNWLSLFETCVRLLRDLAKARSKSLHQTSPVQETLRREAAERLTKLSGLSAPASDTSVATLVRALTESDNTIARESTNIRRSTQT